MPRKKQADIVEADKTQKKPRGSGTASLRKNCDAPEAVISQVVALAHNAMKQPRVKTDEECNQRINQYFDACAAQGVIPIWEELGLYLGVRRDTLWDWSCGRGCSAERTDMVKSAKWALATIDARLAMTNKVNLAAYIFRAKNFYNMRDESEVVLTPRNPLGDIPDQKELEEKLADIVVDED